MNGSSHNKSNINTKKKTDDEVHHHPQVSSTSVLDAISDHSRRSNGKSSNNHNIKRGNIAVSSSSGRNKRTKVLSNLFYVGIVLTLFLALIQVFDPTLDEHITTIRRQQLQQEFYNNNNLLQQNGNPFIIRRQSIQNNQEVIVEGNNNNDHNNNGNSYNQKDGGRGRILQLLNEAGLYNVTSDQMEKLPSWNDVRIYIYTF